MHLRPPGSSDGAPGVLIAHPSDSASHGPRSTLVRKPCLPQGLLGSLRPYGLGATGGRYVDLGPTLQGDLLLLRGGSAKEVL
jgi:hypothetical protein